MIVISVFHCLYETKAFNYVNWTMGKACSSV